MASFHKHIRSHKYSLVLYVPFTKNMNHSLFQDSTSHVQTTVMFFSLNYIRKFPGSFSLLRPPNVIHYFYTLVSFTLPCNSFLHGCLNSLCAYNSQLIDRDKINGLKIISHSCETKKNYFKYNTSFHLKTLYKHSKKHHYKSTGNVEERFKIYKKKKKLQKITNRLKSFFKMPCIKHFFFSPVDNLTLKFSLQSHRVTLLNILSSFSIYTNPKLD